MPQLHRTPRAPAPPGHFPWWAQLAVFAGLAVVGVLVYANSFHAPFVFDSLEFIQQNRAVQDVWPWVTSLGGDPPAVGRNRPVGFLTFALNYAWAFDHTNNGFDVWGYHAVNLAIHVAAAWLLFDIVRRTLSSARLADRYAAHAAALAFAVALLWLVHPLQTESVTYVYQRLESLMALFYLATLWCFVRALNSRINIWWYAASVLCGALGMGSKEVMVTAPLAVLWYDRVFAAASWRELFRKRSVYYAALAGTWGILACLLWANRGGYQPYGVLFVKGVSSIDYALSQPGVILHYLRLAFWPDQLCLDYGWPVAHGAAEIVPQALALGAILILTAWAIYRWPAWGFQAGFFFLVLAPTSSVAPLKDLAFEHRMYLPLAAVAALAVLAVHHAWRYVAPPRAGDRPDESSVEGFVPASLLFFVAALLGWRTAARNEDYQSLRSIWQATAEAAPQNARAHSNFGGVLVDAGEFDRALTEADRAIALDPDFAAAYNTRGNLHSRQKLFEDAIADYNRAIAADPEYENAYCNRGISFHKLNEFQKAIDDFDRALALDPSDVEAYINRGVDYGQLGKLDLAIQDFNHALQLNPNLAQAYVNRALAYYQQGRISLAIADTQRAARLGMPPSPEYAQKLRKAAADARSRGRPVERPRP